TIGRSRRTNIARRKYPRRDAELELNPIVSVAVEHGGLPRGQKDRRERLFDDCRGLDLLPPAHAGAVLDLRHYEAAAEERFAAPLHRGARRGASDRGNLRLVGQTDSGEADTAQNRLLVSCRIGVQALMQRVKALDDVIQGAAAEGGVALGDG